MVKRSFALAGDNIDFEMTEGHSQDQEQIVAFASSLGAIPKRRSPRQVAMRNKVDSM